MPKYRFVHHSPIKITGFRGGTVRTKLDFGNLVADLGDNQKAGDIAIVGMAIQVPGARNLDAFWQNLRDGKESITRQDHQALLDAGETPEKIARSNYVPSAALLDGYDEFDAEFFGFSPKEAAIMDPQHRKFLEVAWEALENAGHPPSKSDGDIGVYAGCGMGSYFYFNICSNPKLVDETGMFLLRHTGNDKDFLSTRVSHVFDLNGPSINLQTACSTSLVAIHYAVQAIRNGDCKMAIAGGSTIELPQGRGYLYQENEILSPDGHCHAFDHRAQGTVFGSGAGAVALRPLEDAIADGDHIWAVVKGSAINNDGAAKSGYLAPSVSGQSEAIIAAQSDANVSAESIDFIECHGTGTYLGDPIEVSALTNAFRRSTDETGYCGIGSVKTNIGHLDTAAGVASFVKSALALHHKEVPPTINFEKPNPYIDFDDSPFFVNAKLRKLEQGDRPLRAGVNSLGVGGTNAHVVLEETPDGLESTPSDWPFHLFTLSGRSKSALAANAENLAQHLRANPGQSLADIAFTLKAGRESFEHRRVIAAKTHEEAAELLEGSDPHRVFEHTKLGETPEMVFMFPGGGAQYPNMGRDLYDTEPVFREWMEKGLTHLETKIDYDIRAIWLPEPKDAEEAARILQKPSVQLPLIMILEYALAQLWMSWGVQPSKLIGHSMGENTAACLAGVMGFEDCIDLVLLRGQLFDQVPAGGMLSIQLSETAIQPYLNEDLDIASINGPDFIVVSGPDAALDILNDRLQKDGLSAQRVPISIAAHSKMLDPILSEFRALLASMDLSAPQIPIMSNRTGQFLTAGEATDPDYWVAHLRNTVRFADGIASLSENENTVFLEVGPGKALSSIAQMSPKCTPNQAFGTLRHVEHDIEDDVYFISVVGRLWAVGVDVDWDQIWGDAQRNRVPLPTYAFQSQKYFIEPGTRETGSTDVPLTRIDDMAEWGFRPVWKPKLVEYDLEIDGVLAPENWLIFADQSSVTSDIISKLRAAHHNVVVVKRGDIFAKQSDHEYLLAPEQGEIGYSDLIRSLMDTEYTPSRIVNFWPTDRVENTRPGANYFDHCQETGFYHLLNLAKAITSEGISSPLHVLSVTAGAVAVRGEPIVYPEKSTIVGAVGVLPKELPGLTAAVLDIEPLAPSGRNLFGGFTNRLKTSLPTQELLKTQILEELLAPPRNYQAAIRGSKRVELDYRPAQLGDEIQGNPFKTGGVYVITGGLGGIGVSIGETLAQRFNAKIALISRSQFPGRDEWDDLLNFRAPTDQLVRQIRAIQKIESAGGLVEIYAADVCNLEQMSEVVSEIRETFGAINGVIHAAGSINDAPALSKSVSEIEAVLAPKIRGLQVLDDIFPDGALDLMILCSSTSTSSQPAGQIDYVAANVYLNAFAESRLGSKTKVQAINWGVWADVGMAGKAIGQDVSGETAEPVKVNDAPLLTDVSFDELGRRVFNTVLNDTSHWVFEEHKTKDGQALIPGTGFIELAFEAMRKTGFDGEFEIADLVFLAPLSATDAQTKQTIVRLTPTGRDYIFEIVAIFEDAGQKSETVHAKAKIKRTTDAFGQNLSAQFSEIQSRFANSAQGSLQSPQSAQLAFGPRWNVLKDTRFAHKEGLAILSLPKSTQEDLEKGFLAHPALLDIATGWALELEPSYRSDTLWVPATYGSIQVFKTLPKEITSWVKLSDSQDVSDGFTSFDIVIFDQSGAVCLVIKNFVMKRLDGDAKFAQTAVQSSSVMAPVQVQKSEAEERLIYNVSMGIRSNEGGDAFLRAVSSDLPNVVVSSLDLHGLIEQAKPKFSAVNGLETAFERPSLESDMVAPRDAVEAKLCEIWQDLLGVKDVGVEDSFFDLGGHSLIAVRLFAAIKKTYQVDFPISVLFEAPTIEKCAELIKDRIGDVAQPAVSEQKSSGKFSYLVPMNMANEGEKPPIFFVAGMFGNVLNLRHLAQHLGNDRAIYGIQARGLLGDAEPHRRIEDAARDYIEEIKKVQPVGPYTIGGFSGGGITAYEMAQQLSASGEDIASLIMLDTPLPVRPVLNTRDKLIIKLHELRRKGLQYFAEWAVSRVKWEFEKRAYRDAAKLGTDPSQYHDKDIEAAFRTAVAVYDLAEYQGRVLLFRPPLDLHWPVSNGNFVSAEREYVFEDNQWTDWIKDLTIVEVPGNHDSMVLEPNVRVLVQRIQEHLMSSDLEQNRTASAALEYTEEGV